MASTLKVFCLQLYNLNKTLSDRFPKSKELSLSLTAVQTMKENNSKKLIEMFVLYAYEYKENILNKDEVFLLNTDYLEKDESNNKKENIDIIKNLKDNWKLLDKDEKEAVWKYLQVLIKLTDKYLSETLKLN